MTMRTYIIMVYAGADILRPCVYPFRYNVIAAPVLVIAAPDQIRGDARNL